MYHKTSTGYRVIYSQIGKTQIKDFTNLKSCLTWIKRNKTFQHTSLEHYTQQPITQTFHTTFY